MWGKILLMQMQIKKNNSEFKIICYLNENHRNTNEVFLLKFLLCKATNSKKKQKALLATELDNKELTVIINKQRAMPTVIIISNN